MAALFSLECSAKPRGQRRETQPQEADQAPFSERQKESDKCVSVTQALNPTEPASTTSPICSHLLKSQGCDQLGNFYSVLSGQINF